MRMLMAGLTLALATVAFVPRPVAAASNCTDAYTKCLNDTWMLEGWLQKMADVECFSDYLGCVRRALFS